MLSVSEGPQYYQVPYTDGTCSYTPFFHMAPAELWMILRDVFVQTKGLQSLLFIMMDLQREREEKVTGGHDDGDESDWVPQLFVVVAAHS